MLIKKKKLLTKKNVQHMATAEQIDLGLLEAQKRAKEEIQKAKEESNKIKQEAQAILLTSNQKLNDAVKEAKEIKERAIQESEELKSKVYAETLEMASKEAEVIKIRAKKLLADLFLVKREVLFQAHKEIINVALDLSEKILRYKASIDPQVLKIQVTEAIKKATADADRIQVYVNSEDKNKLIEYKPDIEKLFPTGTEIIVLTNEDIDIGSCIVETKSGQLDATFKTQLQALVGLVSTIEISEPNIPLEEEVVVENDTIEDLTEEPIISHEDFENNDEEKKSENAASLFAGFMKGKEVTPLKYQFVPPEQINQQKDLNAIDIYLGSGNKEENITEQSAFASEDLESTVPELIEDKAGAESLPVQLEKPQDLEEFNEYINGDSVETLEEIEEVSSELLKEEVDDKEEYNLELEDNGTEELELGHLDSPDILRPKKSDGISNLAKEIEENPDWKGLIEEE